MYNVCPPLLGLVAQVSVLEVDEAGLLQPHQVPPVLLQ